MRVAIQGTDGSFSEAAARRRWPELVTLPCREAAGVGVGACGFGVSFVIVCDGVGWRRARASVDEAA